MKHDKPAFVIRDMIIVYMIDLKRGICKLILKRIFTARDIMESLSEFGLRSLQSSSKYLPWTMLGRFDKEFAELIQISHGDNVMSVLQYKEFEELIKISSVDNVSPVLKRVSRAHQNISLTVPWYLVHFSVISVLFVCFRVQHLT